MINDVFIDLDRAEDRAPAGARRPIRRPSRRQIRVVALAGIAVLLLCLPALSMRQRPLITQLGLFPRPAVGYQNLLLMGDTVIAIADGAVTAFDFDGTTRWSYRSESPVDYMFVEEAPRHEAFLLATMRVGPGAGSRQQLSVTDVVALDRQTGRPRWHVDGIARHADDLIVSGGIKSLRVYQGSPPTLLWQADDFAHSAIDAAARRAWTITDDGTLSERDLATGAVLRHRRLGETGTLTVLGGRLFVFGDSIGTVIAYDAMTLERAEWPSDWLPFRECGPVLCASMHSGRLSSVGAVDRQTGRLLWTMPGDQFVQPSDVGLLATRLGSGSGLTELVGVIDPLTGRLRAPLTGWNIVSSGQGILVRPDRGRLHIARLEADRPRPLGSVPHLSGSCASTDGQVLMCDLSDGRVGVWRLAP